MTGAFLLQGSGRALIWVTNWQLHLKICYN
jgi:hypothetical protein